MDLKNGSTTALNWSRFRRAWNNYELATGLIEKPKSIRLATFLSIIGQDGLQKYDTMSFTNETDKEDIEEVIRKFDEECRPISNILHERYVFLNRKQNHDENIDQFATQLKTLASTCQYTEPDEIIRDQLIVSIKNDAAREKIIDKA